MVYNDIPKENPKKISILSITNTLLSRSLAIILFIGLPFVGFMLGIEYQKSLKQVSSITPNISQDIDQNDDWKTVTSDKAKLSFSYPSAWPIDFEPAEEIIKDNVDYDENNTNIQEEFKNILKIEVIDFTEKWFRNAGGERYGIITVWKQNGIETLDDYVKYIDVEGEIWGKGQTIKIPRPKIKYSVIGGEVAISIYPQGDFARLDSSNDDLEYTVVRRGLIYRFAALKSDRFMQNEEQNLKNFKEIISSIKFLD